MVTMRVKAYETFERDQWPKCRSEAEVKTMEREDDTLLCLNQFGKFSGRSSTGVWCVGIPEDYYQVSNFIYYENTHNRSVIIWSENYDIALRVFQQLEEYGVRMYKNLNNYKFLCHSTPLENFKSILKDNNISEEIKKKLFYLEGNEYWTPDEFVNKANELVFSQIT
jgi:hypothetical protein